MQKVFENDETDLKISNCINFTPLILYLFIYLFFSFPHTLENE